MNQKQLKDTLNDIQIKDDMQRRLIVKCQKAGERKMKRIKKPLIATVAAVMFMCISLTAYAQGFFNVVKTIFIGSRAQYIVTEYSDSYPLPEELRGKLFDSNGNEMTVIAQEDILYNASGDEVRVYHDGYGNLSTLTIEEYNLIEPQTESVEIHDLAEGSAFFISDILNPSYLPDGYKFEKLEFLGISKSELCATNSKYMNIHYTNGVENILCMIRYMDEETAFLSTDDGNIDAYEEIVINGHNALIYKERTLDIQIGNVMYSYFSFENISVDELVKIAESLE